ncbi:unnamed protein product [Prunus armeniaca]|uniref:phosphoserine transaminase n=1 Tax=Prunus armeniaca TaxID=36596 RepID=A0A6J5VI77_PRUAR|nr:unnamed protein product [Prunus armeniaca]
MCGLVFEDYLAQSRPKLIWSGKSDKYTKIPAFEELEQSPDAKFLHICANETIHGVEFKTYPTPKNGLLIADMSSNFCSKPVDVSKFGIIYAGAQKNVGPSGVNLIGNAQEITPVMLDFKIHDENKSLYNTPPCYGIYMCGLVFEDLLEQGGLGEIEKKNKRKADLLYNAIDESKGFYRCPVEKSVRSLMNVPVTLEKPELEAEFVKEAAKETIVQLKGHRSVGGMRASIYNAMPLAGVEKLVAFMKDFQAQDLVAYITGRVVSIFGLLTHHHHLPENHQMVKWKMNGPPTQKLIHNHGTHHFNGNAMNSNRVKDTTSCLLRLYVNISHLCQFISNFNFGYAQFIHIL